MVFCITGCLNRRSTETVTVWALASEVTVPCRILLGMVSGSLLGGRAAGLFVEDRPDARGVAAGAAHLRGVLELAGGRLEPQVELFFLEPDKLFPELVRGLATQIAGLHRHLFLLKTPVSPRQAPQGHPKPGGWISSRANLRTRPGRGF